MTFINRLLAGLRGNAAVAGSGGSISAERLNAELQTMQLIDVREPGEWQAGHIAGAIHIPLGQLPERIRAIDRERPVAVICHSGMRSRSAARILKGHAIDAANVSGGMNAWIRSGLPVVTGGGREGSRR